ncbi:LysR family transcriptional regulator [Rhizobium leguminosarum]|nr:LysR family transcriptional regulator [Rhizobium leguminosarum]
MDIGRIKIRTLDLAHRVGDLEINLLLALDALLREENVTHAAARLNITQSALSGRLNKLRQILNDPLFLPASTGRGVTATPHALAMKPELEQLLERLKQFAQKAHLFDPASSDRTFRIAASDNPAAILAPDLLPLIHDRAPGLRIAFIFPDRSRIGELLEHGDLDLYIGAPDDAPQDLIGRSLFDDELVTAQRIGHPRGTGPLSLDEFCSLDHLLISSDGGMFSGIIDGALAEHGRSRRVTVSVQSYALAPLLVATTDCLCTLPRRLLQRFTHSLDLFEPPLALGRFALKYFWHPKMAADPAHGWLRSMVAEAALDKA